MRAILLLLSSALIWAADITGSWSGSLKTTRNGETRSSATLFVLKQEGSTITGTIGPSEGSRTDITKGSIEGDDVKLEAVVPGPELRVTVDLKLEKEKLVGQMSVARADGQQTTSQLKLERAK